MRDIVRHDEKNAKVRNNLAMIVGPMGNYREAIDLLHEATSHEPSRPEGWQNLAMVLIRCRDPHLRNQSEAIRAALKAVELTKGLSPPALSVLADVYLESGDRPQAVATLEKALQLSPGDAAMHLRAAKIYREMGRGGDAIRHLSADSTKDPS